MRQPLQFYLITDLHYFENTLGASGEAYEARSLTDQKCIAETGAIIDSAFAQLMADTETGIILIAGDMTFNGEAASHRAVIQKLEALRAAGKKIYIITGNHDGDNKPYAFSGAGRFPVEETKRSELPKLYYEYGLKDAIAVADEQRCYVAQLGEGVRLLGINYFLGKHNSGMEDMLPWIAGQVAHARAVGDLIFGMMHVPLLPGSPILAGVGDATIQDGPGVAAALADMGLPLMFTGHMHMQSVNKLTTPSGNFIFDICTGSLVGGPCAIRKITIDANRVMRITTSTVPDFDWDKRGMTADEYFAWRFNRKIEDEISSAVKNKALFKLMRRTSLFPFGVELARNIFYGDQPYTKGTPEYARVMRLLGLLRPAVWAAEKTVGRKNEQFRDIPALAASLIGKERKIDYDAAICLKHGSVKEINH